MDGQRVKEAEALMWWKWSITKNELTIQSEQYKTKVTSIGKMERRKEANRTRTKTTNRTWMLWRSKEASERKRKMWWTWANYRVSIIIICDFIHFMNIGIMALSLSFSISFSIATCTILTFVWITRFGRVCEFECVCAFGCCFIFNYSKCVGASSNGKIRRIKHGKEKEAN